MEVAGSTPAVATLTSFVILVAPELPHGSLRLGHVLARGWPPTTQKNYAKFHP